MLITRGEVDWAYGQYRHALTCCNISEGLHKDISTFLKIRVLSPIIVRNVSRYMAKSGTGEVTTSGYYETKVDIKLGT